MASVAQNPWISADTQHSLARIYTLSVAKTCFWLSVHHILSGCDHLLFISALVLGAPKLWDLVKVVSAFTLAHSITLTLAALNLVRVPETIVEPLISASIIFVALQNCFWPKQARGPARLVVAFCFGLFHGLGFAAGLLEVMHQMPGCIIVYAILGFSVGVELGNQMVLLPLFALIKVISIRSTNTALHRSLPKTVQQIGSAGILVTGTFDLGNALKGAP